MYKIRFFVGFLWLSSVTLCAQEKDSKKSYPEYILSQFSSLPSPELRIKALTKTITPAQADMKFDPFLRHPVSENRAEHYSEIGTLKASKDYLKQEPYKSLRNSKYAEMPVDNDDFQVGYEFYGDIDGSCPNDNTIAISKAGRVISMMNDYVGIYSSQGSKINTYTLGTFFKGLLDNSLCDPKVEYDPEADRFFMYIQECNSDPQYIAFGFSQTNNPNGNWHIYVFDSDALGDGSWTDYPKVAINESEVYVSVNLFGRGASGTYKQSVMYQLNKTQGYSGQTMNYKIWTGFQPGTILPIRSGANGLYGPGIYAVQGRAGGTDHFYFYDITGALNDPNSRLLTTKVTTDPYEPSGNAYQLGTTVRLDIGDCRFQDGYYQNGMIHFVFAADDQGYSGIRYHRLDPTKLNGNNYDLVSSSDLRDYVYPAISPFGKVNDQTSIVHFSSSGENHYPDMRAKLYFNDFTSDPSRRIKVGTGSQYSCYSSSKNSARWGDYNGIARHYGKTNPTVWVAGSVGNDINGKWRTYIAEIISVTTQTNESEKNFKLEVFPNPTSDRYSVILNSDIKEFVKFKLHDIRGKLIAELYEGLLIPGENKFSFSTSQLNNGVYFLIIESNQHEQKKSIQISIYR